MTAAERGRQPTYPGRLRRAERFKVEEIIRRAVDQATAARGVAA
jgi:hypothetical protein